VSEHKQRQPTDLKMQRGIAMNTKPVDKTFDPQTLANDLLEVRRIYAEFFVALNESDWDKPVKGGSKEWTLHETIAHLCALNGAGLESIKHTLRGEPYIFTGLEDRYKLNAYNRKGIDDLLDIPMKELCARFLGIHNEAARIAHGLRPDQAGLTSSMSIYNRPVSIVEALSILTFHAGVIHATQVAEPAGVPPLWEQLSPGFRQRAIERVMRAFSLLYRLDIGGSLRATLAFRIDGPDGGEWYVKLSPDADGAIQPSQWFDQRKDETTRRPAPVPAHEHPLQRGCQTASGCESRVSIDLQHLMEK
jgi:hypothetical protein